MEARERRGAEGSPLASAPGGVQGTPPINKEPERIARMFDQIAWRYDRLNHLLSAGIDRRWRRRAIQELQLTGRERVLDVCTGTADLAIAAAGGGAASV